jgi:hypothetical protein
MAVDKLEMDFVGGRPKIRRFSSRCAVAGPRGRFVSSLHAAVGLWPFPESRHLWYIAYLDSLPDYTNGSPFVTHK